MHPIAPSRRRATAGQPSGNRGFGQPLRATVRLRNSSNTAISRRQTARICGDQPFGRGLLSRGSQVRVLPGACTNPTAPSSTRPQTPASTENADRTEPHQEAPRLREQLADGWRLGGNRHPNLGGEQATVSKAGRGGSPLAWTLRFLRGVSEGSCGYRVEFGRPAIGKTRRGSKCFPGSPKRSRGIAKQHTPSGSATSLPASLVRRLAAAARRYTAAGLTERVPARAWQEARP